MPSGLIFSGSGDPRAVKFSQCGGAIVVALTSGFKVLNADPIITITSVKLDTGGVKLAEPLFRTNIYALVPNGGSREYPETSLYFYDTFQHKMVNFISFGKTILDVFMNRDIVAVLLKDGVKVYGINDLMFLDEIEIPSGLSIQPSVAVSTQQGAPLVACAMDKTVKLLWISSRRRVLGEIKVPHPIISLSMWSSSHVLLTTSTYSVIYDIQNLIAPKALLVLKHPQLTHGAATTFDPNYAVLCHDGTVNVYSLADNGDDTGDQRDVLVGSSKSPATGITTTTNNNNNNNASSATAVQSETGLPAIYASLRCIHAEATYNPKLGKNCIVNMFAEGITLVYDKKVIVRLVLGSRSMKVTAKATLDRHNLK